LLDRCGLGAESDAAVATVARRRGRGAVVSAARTWTVLLWVDTQSLQDHAAHHGALRAAGGAAGRPWWTAPARRRRWASTLLPHWRRLKSQPVGRKPTAQDFIDIPLITNSGNTLRLRDVRGGLSRQLEDPVVLRELIAFAPDAYLFMLEWGTRDLNNQMLAVTASLTCAATGPRGLVFHEVRARVRRGRPLLARRAGLVAHSPVALASRARAGRLRRRGVAVLGVRFTTSGSASRRCSWASSGS